MICMLNVNLLNTIVFLGFFVLPGGTNEKYNSDDPSIKKCLRKTRGELLLQEYEVGCFLPFIYT